MQHQAFPVGKLESFLIGKISPDRFGASQSSLFSSLIQQLQAHSDILLLGCDPVLLSGPQHGQLDRLQFLIVPDPVLDPAPDLLQQGFNRITGPDGQRALGQDNIIGLFISSFDEPGCCRQFDDFCDRFVCRQSKHLIESKRFGGVIECDNFDDLVTG